MNPNKIFGYKTFNKIILALILNRLKYLSFVFAAFGLPGIHVQVFSRQAIN